MKTILITGATSGIGLALARLYKDSRLILLGRTPLAQLEDTLFTAQTYCQCDLSRADCAEHLRAFLSSQGINKLELVIHNAGVGYYGPPQGQPDASINQLLAVNLHAPLTLTHALLPLMQQGSKLVFISSVAADLPVADYAVYGATKAALAGFARNLRLELSPNIQVQTIYPGAVATAMHAKSGVPAGTFNTESFPSAEQVARQIKKAIAGRRAEVTLGFSNRVGRQLGRHFPNLVTFLLRRAAK